MRINNYRWGTPILVIIGFQVILLLSEALAADRIVFEQLVSGLRYPVDINNAGDGSDRLFVVEQDGIIKIIKNGSVQSTPLRIRTAS